jgi:6-phosphogluconolactonase
MSESLVVTSDVPGAFAAAVSAEIMDNKQWSIALSGGSTARPCYEALAGCGLDWTGASVIWGDERQVELTHPDSNYALARDALLDRVGTIGHVHPMIGDANAYAQVVKSLAPIDVVHLGMGDDGHTASLFPGSPALEAPAGVSVVEAGDELHSHPRLSLTFEAINSAKLIIFTVTGANKQAMLKRVRNGDDFPAAKVAGARVLWLVDPSAAGA